MIKKTWQYMLNVIPYIFSLINFCVRTLVFFYNRKKPYFLNIRNQSIFYNKLAVFRTNFSGIPSLKFYQQIQKNPRASDGYVQYNRILNLIIIFIITVAAGKILIFHLPRKKVCKQVQSLENFQRESCSAGFQAVFQYILRFFNPKLRSGWEFL